MEVAKVTKEKKKAGEFHSKVEHFAQFKGKPMVFIAGSFYQGGFLISKNKVRAILDNADLLKKFVSGEWDAEIKKLKDDEILKL